ncbi:MAG: hypothetical protein ACK2U9_08515 [Anaerolineae bacterium]
MNDTITRGAPTDRDPLGLAELPLLEPAEDGWPAIEQALQAGQRQSRFSPRTALAAVAGLALAALLLTLLPRFGGEQAPVQQTALNADPVIDVLTQEDQRLADLILLSQGLEARLRALREQTASLPAQSAFYVAELEDTIAQVDDAISATPEALDLWGQRVNLLLDLELIYEHQWQREYGRMASL